MIKPYSLFPIYFPDFALLPAPSSHFTKPLNDAMTPNITVTTDFKFVVFHFGIVYDLAGGCRASASTPQNVLMPSLSLAQGCSASGAVLCDPKKDASKLCLYQ